MNIGEREFHQITNMIDEVRGSLLQLKNNKAEAIDLDNAVVPLKLLAQTWVGIYLPDQDHEKFADLIRQRIDETLSPMLWFAMGPIIAGALEYAARAAGATVMPSFDVLSTMVMAEQSYTDDDEEALLISCAERIRIKGTLQVSLNWGEIESILDEFFGSTLSACKTEQEALTAWNSFLKKEQKHLKRRLGDSPVEKILETNKRVELLTDEQRKQMRSDLVKLASQNFKLNMDHVIRCAIAANLFLSLVYWRYAFDRERGIVEKEAEQSLPGVEELRDVICKRLSDWLITPLPKKPRGGDRKSSSKLAEADVEKLRARKEDLSRFWRYLLSELEKHDYEDDVWPWLRRRESFRQKLHEYEITDISILEELVEEALKRRPYVLKEISERMPESLTPAAFAQQQAALEMQIDGNYDAIKKKIQSKKAKE